MPLETPTKVIRPITITSSMIASLDATNFHSQWNDYDYYDVGDLVMVTTGNTYANQITHRIYKASHNPINDNNNRDPTSTPAGETGTYWENLSNLNRDKMFDNSPGDQTTKASSLSLTLTPGVVFNSLALINVEADSVTITITSGKGGGVIFSETISLIDTDFIYDWYDYFFEPVNYKSNVVRFDIPPYDDSIIEADFTRSGGADVKIGGFVIGNSAEIGSAAQGSSDSLTDRFSTTQNSENGTVLESGDFIRKCSMQLDVENWKWPAVTDILRGLKTTPCVWVVDEELSSQIHYGPFRSYDAVARSGLTRINLNIWALNAK